MGWNQNVLEDIFRQAAAYSPVWRVRKRPRLLVAICWLA